MRMLVAWLALLLLAGCSDESKMKSACLGIAEEMSVDPSSVTVNSTEVVKSKLKFTEMLTILSKKFGGNTPPSVTTHTNALFNSGEYPDYVMVQIDYTSNSNHGKSRDKILCTYVDKVLPDAFLLTVTAKNKDISGASLEALLTDIKRPKQLDDSLSLK